MMFKILASYGEWIYEEAPQWLAYAIKLTRECPVFLSPCLLRKVPNPPIPAAPN